jgi:nigerose phosphorylase
MELWKVSEEGFNKDDIVTNGNRYLTGNGYMGNRGCPEEFEKEYLPAINLAGVYDQVGNAWREPINAPNALYTYIIIDDVKYSLPELEAAEHRFELDIRKGILHRITSWKTHQGMVKIESERFTSMSDKHGIALNYSISTDFDCTITIVTGIDCAVWDINGPHFDDITMDACDDMLENRLEVFATTHEKKDIICVMESCRVQGISNWTIIREKDKILQDIKIQAKAGEVYTMYKWVSVFTSLDSRTYSEDARIHNKNGIIAGYQSRKEEHVREWEKLWQVSEVIINGDAQAMKALNYSVYHLHSIAPRHSKSMSIAARGLSGQTYKGAIFWDTEMFMLPFFLYTEPEVARTLLKYRIDTLEGAKKKAMSYGFQGAFYAWESQEGGIDACTDYNVTDVFTGRPMRTYFKDKQVHISSAIVYAMMSYVDFTKDKSILKEGGARVVIECALFYYSLLLKRAGKEKYEIHDVIGPDEYHERVNNNGYTNRMAKYCFDKAITIIDMIQNSEIKEWQEFPEAFDLCGLKANFKDAFIHIHIPGEDSNTKVIEQFDGYFDLEDASVEEVRSRLIDPKEYWGGANGVASHTRVIKQADVITWLNLFSDEYTEEALLKNWEYYEPRTEHGSSLSACMYALVACKCNMPEKAYPFFMKSARADLTEQGKQWAGKIYIGGTHPAAAGGAYMTLVQGFAGLKFHNGELHVEARLPEQWVDVRFQIKYNNNIYQIYLDHSKSEIIKL